MRVCESQNFEIDVTFYDAGGVECTTPKIVKASVNPKIATITMNKDRTFTLTAVGTGCTYLILTSSDGKKFRRRITVERAPRRFNEMLI
jgi:hypothetical protein